MCSGCLSPSFSCLLRVLSPGDFNLVNLCQQQPVFLSSFVFSMFDVLHTAINSVYVQNLPTVQATSVVTDFFAGL